MEEGQASERVVAHFDVDCFYAQAEILRHPDLQERPVGVTQKFLVVTCNYVARQLGVPKMVPIQEAKRRCPDLVLINGEDLTPYRASSKEILKVLGRFGTLERRGLDEAAVDITMQVLRRVRLKCPVNSFSGHVLGLDDNYLQATEVSGFCNYGTANMARGDYLLMIGSQIVMEIRTAVEKETGFRCSCGIANNKMLAKLVCSINKPNKQTCILQSAVMAFLDPLAVHKLPGVGHRMESLLKEIGVETISDLQKVPMWQLCAKFGDRIGMFLYNSCRGVDHSPVQDKGPPKSLSVEDSFRSCTSLKQVEDILRSLAPDLLARLDGDKEETGRQPKLLTVKWRHKGSWNFTSASAPMPMEVLLTTLPSEKRQEIAIDVAMKLIFQNLGGRSFCLGVLNIGAANFSDNQKTNLCASHDIRSFLNNSKSGRYERNVTSTLKSSISGCSFEGEDDPFLNSSSAKSVSYSSDNKTDIHGSPQQQSISELYTMQLQDASSNSDEEELVQVESAGIYRNIFERPNSNINCAAYTEAMAMDPSTAYKNTSINWLPETVLQDAKLIDGIQLEGNHVEASRN
eukprot:c26179_g1_i1 orf=32-1747(+)